MIVFFSSHFSWRHLLLLSESVVYLYILCAWERYLIMCNFGFTMMAHIFCRPHFHILCNAIMLVVVTHIDPLHHDTSFAILQLHRFSNKFSFVSTSSNCWWHFQFWLFSQKMRFCLNHAFVRVTTLKYYGSWCHCWWVFSPFQSGIILVNGTHSPKHSPLKLSI